MNPKTLVTHNGDFHTDEILAVAIVRLKFGAENISVVRTRDPKLFETADIVLDVGGEYNPASMRFDHHQIGGAGQRANGVPFASCGLVWKEFGEELCGSSDVASSIDDRLIAPIDAGDNGVATYTPVYDDVRPYTIQDTFAMFSPTWNESDTIDTIFLELVALAEKIITREIAHATARVAAASRVIEAYKNASDKRIVILDDKLPWGDALCEYPEVMFVISPDKINDTWRVKTVRQSPHSFVSRKDLPESWAGKRDAELAEVTGVPDAIFCHTKRFMAVAKSKEGAIALAGRAL